MIADMLFRGMGDSLLSRDNDRYIGKFAGLDCEMHMFAFSSLYETYSAK
jgi:hypothetical protein